MSEEADGQIKTPWYRTGRGILLGLASGFVLLLILAGQKNPAQTPSTTNPPALVQPQSVVQEAPASMSAGQVAGTSVVATPSMTVQKQNTQTQQSTDGLSNDNYYKNVDGNTVHSPAYSNSVPQGATARCGDGTYSFSQHRSGTCSHHGGVSQWL